MADTTAMGKAAAPRRHVNWSARAVGRFKPVLFVLGLLPFAHWVWLGFHDDLTANPVEFLTRGSGTWTLVCLLITLGITPLRRLLNQPALVRLRRMCGLFTYFYAFQHFLAWVWWDRGFSLASMWKDIHERPFILVGFAAFVLMSALAATSTNWSMRKMGKRWQTLHKLIYLIGMLAILHFWWHKAGKHDFFLPIVYGAIMTLLLGWRVINVAIQRRRQHIAPPRPAGVVARGSLGAGQADGAPNQAVTASRQG